MVNLRWLGLLKTVISVLLLSEGHQKLDPHFSIQLGLVSCQLYRVKILTFMTGQKLLLCIVMGTNMQVIVKTRYNIKIRNFIFEEVEM